MSSKESVPKVAVVTRTKDRNIFLERAIESVQQQTMKDFVQVVINDGGNEKAVEKIVNKYKEHGQLRLIHNKKERQGLTKALNEAIRQSDSKYIAILDDDDTWHPDFLKMTTEYLDRTKAKGIVTLLDRIIEKTENNKIKFVSKNRWRPDISSVSLYGQCLDNYAPTVAFVYQRNIYEELNGYDESLNVAEDWDFTIRFLLKYDIDFLHTKEALAFYHHRPEASGANGNSVFFGVKEHKYHLNMLANKYLREDIEQGRLGVGYIMNNLHWQQDVTMKKMKDWEDKQTVRLEGHINHASEILRKNIEQDVIRNVENRRYYNKLKRLIKKVAKKN